MSPLPFMYHSEVGRGVGGIASMALTTNMLRGDGRNLLAKLALQLKLPLTTFPRHLINTSFCVP
jgi:hypothetical protein